MTTESKKGSIFTSVSDLAGLSPPPKLKVQTQAQSVKTEFNSVPIKCVSPKMSTSESTDPQLALLRHMDMNMMLAAACYSNPFMLAALNNQAHTASMHNSPAALWHSFMAQPSLLMGHLHPATTAASLGLTNTSKMKSTTMTIADVSLNSQPNTNNHSAKSNTNSKPSTIQMAASSASAIVPPSATSKDTTAPAKPGAQSTQAPRFQCGDCSRSYSTFSGLSKHRQFHCSSQMKRQFGCKLCDKQYTSLGALKMHIRTHTLPCKCGVCGKAFSRPWLLQGHLRTHTGEKPFRCGHCARSFADRSNLRAHLQTHSDVKKYKCADCHKTFSRMSLLVKHEHNGCTH